MDDEQPLWTFNALLLFNTSDLFSWFCSFLAEASEAELRIFLTAVPDRTLSNAVWLRLALILGVKIKIRLVVFHAYANMGSQVFKGGIQN